MSNDAYEVIQGLLQRDPTARLGYDGMGKMKTMPWFSNIGYVAPKCRVVLAAAGMMLTPKAHCSFCVQMGFGLGET